MSKTVAVTKEILRLNFKQAYEVMMCKCDCWTRRRAEDGAV